MRALPVNLLNAALASAGIADDRCITGFEVLGQFSAHRASVVRLRVAFSSPRVGDPETIIAKSCAGHAFVAEGLPEIRFFQELAPLAGLLPIATCLGWIVDQDGQISLLLTEDLSDRYQRICAPVSDRTTQTVVDEIVSIHARFWNHPVLQNDQFATPRDNETRMPQAAPASVIRANAACLDPYLTEFMGRFRGELTPAETELLVSLQQSWETHFLKRVARGNVTLIHGDFHLLGNIFVPKSSDDQRADDVRIIDWADCKPGLGPHDVAYCLVSVDASDRVSRDTRMLQRHHQRLLALGITGYGWEQCLWDYRFALLTNLLQAFCKRAWAGSARRWRSSTRGTAPRSSPRDQSVTIEPAPSHILLTAGIMRGCFSSDMLVACLRGRLFSMNWSICHGGFHESKPASRDHD
ncbi:MAG: phosphotransferase [Thermomicrobiales bacterium]